MVKYDPDWVKCYYDQFAEREWQRWDKSPVEHIKLEIHLHYLRTVLSPTDRILEIGAGAGRFTRELAKIVAKTVVADLSPVQLQLNRENARDWGFSGAVERWVECDICDLVGTHFQEAEFDAVVCYGGPLSYVFDERDKAIGELSRVTKPGGIVLLSVMSLWGSAHHALPGVLQVDPVVNSAILATGDLDPTTAGIATQRCHLFRGAELRCFLERAGLLVEVLSASDCLSANWADALESVQNDRDKWPYLLEMEIEACREPGCVDMGTHLIAVCRKPT
ncbi:MAG: methyltransferase domain-containing protein [Anaerolineae bacterium]|nr:methyltransferase domain-containing protein [Anaerolineae bacterium]